MLFRCFSADKVIHFCSLAKQFGKAWNVIPECFNFVLGTSLVLKELHSPRAEVDRRVLIGFRG